MKLLLVNKKVITVKRGSIYSSEKILVRIFTSEFRFSSELKKNKLFFRQNYLFFRQN